MTQTLRLFLYCLIVSMGICFNIPAVALSAESGVSPYAQEKVKKKLHRKKTSKKHTQSKAEKKQRIPATKQIAQAAKEAANATAQQQATEPLWVGIESGLRPVYVGIHGGTAPVTLLRSPDGSLFAFTGQTGNDFMHVLQGNTTKSQGKINATPAADVTARFTKVQALATMTTAASLSIFVPIATEEQTATSQIHAVAKETVHQEAVQSNVTDMRANQQPARAVLPAPANDLHTPAAKMALPATQNASERTPIVMQVAVNNATPPAVQPNATATVSQSSPTNASKRQIPFPRINGTTPLTMADIETLAGLVQALQPELVFVSSDKAKQILQDSASFAPFGLTAPADTNASELLTEHTTDVTSVQHTAATDKYQVFPQNWRWLDLADYTDLLNKSS